jgi:hypothetical protein
MSDEFLDTTPWRSHLWPLSWWQRVLGYLVGLPVLVYLGAIIGDVTYDCPPDAADCDLGWGNVMAGATIALALGLLLIVAGEITLAVRRKRR